MANKPFDKLNVLDRMLRQAVPTGPGVEGVQITIEKVCGFEMFNTRPYHNYETWGDGYRIRDQWGVEATAEDLDDAVAAYCAKRQAITQAAIDRGDLKRWAIGMDPMPTGESE